MMVASEMMAALEMMASLVMTVLPATTEVLVIPMNLGPQTVMAVLGTMVAVPQKTGSHKTRTPVR
jgi:hypothetical protein